jgi:hypothetical protein
LEDLIQHALALFDERPSPSPLVPSPDVADTSHTTSAYTRGSLFLSPEFPQLPEVQTMGSTTRHRPRLVGTIPTFIQSSFLLPSDPAMESHLTPPPNAMLSPLPGLSLSNTPTEAVEATTQEQDIPKVRRTNTVEKLAISIPAEPASVPPLTSAVAEWRLRQSRLSPQPEAMTIPESPPESVQSSTSNFPISSATSLQTGMGR